MAAVHFALPYLVIFPEFFAAIRTLEGQHGCRERGSGQSDRVNLAKHRRPSFQEEERRRLVSYDVFRLFFYKRNIFHINALDVTDKPDQEIGLQFGQCFARIILGHFLNGLQFL